MNKLKFSLKFCLYTKIRIYSLVRKQASYLSAEDGGLCVVAPPNPGGERMAGGSAVVAPFRCVSVFYLHSKYFYYYLL